MKRLTIPDEPIEGGKRVRLIDAHEVRSHAMEFYWALEKYEDTGLTPEEAGALAQGIVRCKDCKHHILHKHSPHFYKCGKIQYLRARLVSGDFGCVRGEKG